jgi:hypothetical protein
MKVVPAAEDLKIIAVGYKSLSDLIDLFWLLRLSSPLTEYDIALDVEAGFVRDVAANTNKAGLFGMLKIVAVPLCNLAIYSLLNPGNFIDETIAILLHHVKGHAIFGVDNPDEKETVTLNLVKGYVEDLFIIQGVISNGDSSCRISRR